MLFAIVALADRRLCVYPIIQWSGMPADLVVSVMGDDRVTDCLEQIRRGVLQIGVEYHNLEYGVVHNIFSVWAAFADGKAYEVVS